MIDRCQPNHRQAVFADAGVVCGLMVAVSAWRATAVLADDNVSEGVKAPSGFDVRLIADDDLVPDIYSLSIDASGRVVVSGRGYVRILLDQDSDGIADSFRQFADGPATGAMGMYWDGPNLICTGDAGLLRYRDADGDDRTDGPPEVLLSAKTGGEHDIHAIRRGPDGWWYLLGGNQAGLDERYVTLPSSPVTSPTSGAMVRITSDFARSEVVADGFRNPYDFDFNAEGRLFTFDSDGERDVSLPWYRPTRVFEILPGAHAGWFSRSWKRPGYFIDMPPVVAAFGRGSPTGVECYRHTQFPEQYRNGLFVLDWTYGRVMFVSPVNEQSQPVRDPEEFLTGVGSFGFAPTDAAVGPDGSLYVSVGGRGSRGGVYRIRWIDGVGAWPAGTRLEQCLRAPQPLCSWSRARWEPLLTQLTADEFLAAARDEQRPAPERVRAIEILCEHFRGIDETRAEELFQSTSSAVRARTAWCLGRQLAPTDISILAQRLSDEDVSVTRAAAEAILALHTGEVGHNEPAFDSRLLLPALATRHRPTLHALARIIARRSEDDMAQIAKQVPPDDPAAQFTLAFGRILRGEEERSSALTDLFSPKFGKALADRPVDVIRLVQIALGDFGPGDHAPVFDGYTAASGPAPEPFEVQNLKHFGSRVFPSGIATLDRELARIFAMLQSENPDTFANILNQLTEDSHPVEDIHYLIVAARLPAPRTKDQTRHVARSLLALDEKIQRLGLHRDSNWDDRIGETYAAHVELDSRLPEAIIAQERFGQPGHVIYAEQLTDAVRKGRAVDAFVRAIGADPDYRWNNEIVRFLSESERDDVRTLLKDQAEEFAVQSSVLIALAKQPQRDERALFLTGLQSSDIAVLRQMVAALKTLGPDESSAEQVALVRTLRRLGDDQRESGLKASILRRLEQNTGVTLGPQTGTEDPIDAQRELTDRWSVWVQQHDPDQWAAQTGDSLAEENQLEGFLDDVDWAAGRPERGESLFHKRSCAQCHGGRRALGPDLRGVGGRFSRKDLFTAIALPNRDVSPRYQTTLIVTDDGQTHSGIIIYESIDGLLLRNGQGETVRIEASEIDERRSLPASIMPAGLLKDLRPADLADLYAYLRSLK